MSNVYCCLSLSLCLSSSLYPCPSCLNAAVLRHLLSLSLSVFSYPFPISLALSPLYCYIFACVFLSLSNFPTVFISHPSLPLSLCLSSSLYPCPSCLNAAVLRHLFSCLSQSFLTLSPSLLLSLSPLYCYIFACVFLSLSNFPTVFISHPSLPLSLCLSSSLYPCPSCLNAAVLCHIFSCLSQSFLTLFPSLLLSFSCLLPFLFAYISVFIQFPNCLHFSSLFTSLSLSFLFSLPLSFLSQCRSPAPSFFLSLSVFSYPFPISLALSPLYCYIFACVFLSLSNFPTVFISHPSLPLSLCLSSSLYPCPSCLNATVLRHLFSCLSQSFLTLSPSLLLSLLSIAISLHVYFYLYPISQLSSFLIPLYLSLSVFPLLFTLVLPVSMPQSCAIFFPVSLSLFLPFSHLSCSLSPVYCHFSLHVYFYLYPISQLSSFLIPLYLSLLISPFPLSFSFSSPVSYIVPASQCSHTFIFSDINSLVPLYFSPIFHLSPLLQYLFLSAWLLHWLVCHIFCPFVPLLIFFSISFFVSLSSLHRFLSLSLPLSISLPFVAVIFVTGNFLPLSCSPPIQDVPPLPVDVIQGHFLLLLLLDSPSPRLFLVPVYPN